MSVNVFYYLHNVDRWPKEVHKTLKSTDDVDRFIDILSDANTSEAVIFHYGRPLRDTKIPDEKSPTGWVQTKDHHISIFIEGNYGAILYSGNDGFSDKGVTLYSAGSGPEEPLDLESAFFPTDTFIHVDQLKAALRAFLETAKRPQNITWRTEDGEIIETARKSK